MRKKIHFFRFDCFVDKLTGNKIINDDCKWHNNRENDREGEIANN